MNDFQKLISLIEDVDKDELHFMEEKALQRIERLYPKIKGNSIDGFTIGDEIHNMDSISATWTDYEILDGIRKVPHTWAYNPGHMDKAYNIKLKNKIEETKFITPLIIAIDADDINLWPYEPHEISDESYPWVLEGRHRSEALGMMGVTHVPAVVVVGYRY